MNSERRKVERLKEVILFRISFFPGSFFAGGKQKAMRGKTHG